MWYLLLLPVILCVAVYFFRRPLLARLLELSPPSYSVRVERAIAVPMADGVRLLTDHYRPKAKGEFPTILIRTPYGRGREVFLFGGYPLAELPGQRFAERGYHVIVQGVRGCYDSEGEFKPHINEAADGHATARWISEQPWFDGHLAAWGPSYLGYTAWAAVATAPTLFRAIMPVITSAENYSVTHPDGAFGLETRLRWSQGLARARQLHDRTLFGRLRQRCYGNSEDLLQVAYEHLPLRDADEVAADQPIQFYREMLSNDSAEDAYWTARDNSGFVAQIETPAHLIGGWYDYYLRGLLRDYRTLMDAGHRPQLTIGPWHHAGADGLLTGLREGLKWFDAEFKGATDENRQPVRVYVMGAGEWREMQEFPPSSERSLQYLVDGGHLSTDLPQPISRPSTFTYDPSDPTPALGGALLAFKGAGPVDNRPLEARPDVLSFTGPVLQESLEIIGHVTLILFIHSSRPFTDFFGRLCDVFPDGRSINVCDGLFRVRLGDVPFHDDSSQKITVDMASTAYSFLSGHRLRLLVSSGAHPRWNRNLGTGEAEATATSVIVAEQVVYHDKDRPSALQLPLV